MPDHPVQEAAYTVTFDANGGAGLSETSRKAERNAKLGTLPSVRRIGYAFQGWYTARTGGTKVSADTIVTKDLTLYAQWQAVSSGSGDTSGSQTADVGTKLSSGKVTYKVTRKGAEVSYEKMSSKASAVTIPATAKIGGVTYKVTSVAPNALKGDKKVKKVTIGMNVTSIGKNAFSGCKNLKTITIKSAKLKKVGKNAFKGIKSNAKIKVPAKKLAAYQKLLKGKGQGKSGQSVPQKTAYF